MKITKSQLKQIIREEASRLKNATEEEQFDTWEEYAASKYPKDPQNKWYINGAESIDPWSNTKHGTGRWWFNKHRNEQGIFRVKPYKDTYIGKFGFEGEEEGSSPHNNYGGGWLLPNGRMLSMKPIKNKSVNESNKKGKMKITKSQLKQIIREEASRLKKQYILEDKKKAIVKELRMLNEGSEGKNDNWYVAKAPGSTPEQGTRVQVFQAMSYKDVEEYEENDWMVDGPMSEEEAYIKQDKVERGNALNTYLDQFSEDEVYRSEQNWMRDGDDGMSKPSHIAAIGDYHKQNKEADSRISDIKKRKLRNSKEW